MGTLQKNIDQENTNELINALINYIKRTLDSTLDLIILLQNQCSLSDIKERGLLSDIKELHNVLKAVQAYKAQLGAELMLEEPMPGTLEQESLPLDCSQGANKTPITEEPSLLPEGQGTVEGASSWLASPYYSTNSDLGITELMASGTLETLGLTWSLIHSTGDCTGG